MNLIDLVFWGTMTTVGLLDLALLATLLVPSLQLWPPLGRNTCQFYFTWICFFAATIGFLVIGGLDAGSLGLHAWIGGAGGRILGSALFMVGTAIASYAMGFLGMRAPLGLEDTLVTEGPFAVSRNPGYVGDLILLAGYVVLVDSRLAGIVGAGIALWFVVAPWAEEPWLERQYGDAYRHYKNHHPRFLGVPQRWQF